MHKYDMILYPYCCQGLVLLGFVIMMMHGHNFLTAYKIGMHCRITLTAAIYQKVCGSSIISPIKQEICDQSTCPCVGIRNSTNSHTCMTCRKICLKIAFPLIRPLENFLLCTILCQVVDLWFFPWLPDIITESGDHWQAFYWTHCQPCIEWCSTIWTSK